MCSITSGGRMQASLGTVMMLIVVGVSEVPAASLQQSSEFPSNC
jgi:hypothetical protein